MKLKNTVAISLVACLSFAPVASAGSKQKPPPGNDTQSIVVVLENWFSDLIK